MKPLYLHTVPEWPGKLKEKYQGKSIMEALNYHNPETGERGAYAVLWCVEKRGWVLDELAADELQHRLKEIRKGDKGHTGRNKRNNSTKHFWK